MSSSVVDQFETEMRITDIERQQANVFRMKLLGAEVIPVVAVPARSRTP